MNEKRMIGGAAVIAMAVAGIAIASSLRGNQGDALPPVPAAPAGQKTVELLFAQPYLLDEGYTHWWRAELPTVDAGYLLVLAVEPDLVHPRQGYQPVLYAGTQTAERLNVGFVPEEIAPAGKAHVVAFVPAAHDGKGKVALDLGRTPLWFGTPELPEQVDETRIRAEYALARAQGVVPPSAAAIDAARREGGGEVYLPDYQALVHHAAALIARYSPGEQDLVESLTAPPPERARIVR